MRGDSNVTQKQDLVLSTATQHFHQQKEISLHTFLLCDKQVAESRHHGVLHFLQDHYSYSTVHSQSRAGSFHDEKTDGPWIQEHRYTVNKQCLRPNVTLTVKGISSVGHTEDSTGLLSVGLSYLFPDRLHFFIWNIMRHCTCNICPPLSSDIRLNLYGLLKTSCATALLLWYCFTDSAGCSSRSVWIQSERCGKQRLKVSTISGPWNVCHCAWVKAHLPQLSLTAAPPWHIAPGCRSNSKQATYDTSVRPTAVPAISATENVP